MSTALVGPRLVQLESNIRTGQGDYTAVGKALTEIQAARLYKGSYNTFEEYCEKRWGFERQTAYDYIHAADVCENVRLSVQSPPEFTQAREMSVLLPEQQREVASRINFKTATVHDVKKAVQAKLGKPQEPPKPKESKEIPLAEALEVFVTKIVMQPYGYYAAKFSKYSFQHPTEMAVLEKAKQEVYAEIADICRGSAA